MFVRGFLLCSPVRVPQTEGGEDPPGLVTWKMSVSHRVWAVPKTPRSEATKPAAYAMSGIRIRKGLDIGCYAELLMG